MKDGCSESKLSVDVLMPSVYEELRRLANRYLLGERPGHTLRPTALVHETYLRLANGCTEWHDELKFLAAAASAMRHILIDHARAQGRQKRGGRPKKVTLDETLAVGEGDLPGLLDLDEALQKLAQHDERKSRIIELLFFGGLTYDECAAILNISPVTLYRELKAAKAWLYHELAPAARPA
jgi:RNA polymerase sigma factor (TIGR02999 family)